MPARDTFELLGRVYELSPAEHRARLRDLVEAFELGPLLDKPVSQLSLGQRMRAEIAASLLHRPRILFLDEPTIGLDVSAKSVIRQLLQRKSDEDGATLLLTSHDTGDIERVCRRVIVIHGGRVVSDGSISELRRGYLAAKRVRLWMERESLSLALAVGAGQVSLQQQRRLLGARAARTDGGKSVTSVTLCYLEPLAHVLLGPRIHESS